MPLAIIHEDDDLLVVVKAQGMLVHPTRGVKSGTLLNALVYHLNRDLIQRANFEVALRPGLVHRLDKATSGLMVIAKNQRALSILSRHFHLRLVEKKYTALVRGCVATDEMLINEPIGRQEEGWPKWRVLKTGKAAETHLRVIERRELSTLLELEPRTGRTNQLRIHCSAVGHPIVGDDIYGDGEASSPRLCLHAAHLAFHHPANGEWLEFNSEPRKRSFLPRLRIKSLWISLVFNSVFLCG
ncbi:MAG: RluA family pseudouridine synthase [Pyrinomonadaceae bacterium]